MIEEYRLAVLRMYREKKEAGVLSINLTHPTCANLRNECLARYRQGCNRSDLRMLQDFLGRPNDEGLYDNAIKRCDPEKFKPLNNFLKNGIKSHERNIELLAWLVDFQLRPSTTYYTQPKPVSGPAVNIAKSQEKKTDWFPPRNSNPDIHKFLSVEAEGISDHLLATSGYGIHQSVTEGAQHVEVLLASKERQLPYTQQIVERSEIFIGKREIPQQVTIEYPSGARLSVDASDLSLIAQLVRL